MQPSQLTVPMPVGIFQRFEKLLINAEQPHQYCDYLNSKITIAIERVNWALP